MQGSSRKEFTTRVVLAGSEGCVSAAAAMRGVGLLKLKFSLVIKLS